MRYSYEYKLKCIEMYRKGEYPETPDGISTKNFRREIRVWVKQEEALSPEALKHPAHNRNRTPEEKLELVSRVLAGETYKSVAFSEGINDGLLCQWVHKYKTLGYNGLINKKRGRPGKESEMKKKDISQEPLTESEREELIRLRAEIAYIKAEDAVIKKRIALRKQKQAALLEAKKQRSSKNSGKKGTN